mmetsp:Transcript_25456/g.38076  ORF Transcript_25456/g.38076 Transcript_25456/m.38076 type:complete len:87 (-) Transcript_25456:417-677(-)
MLVKALATVGNKKLPTEMANDAYIGLPGIIQNPRRKKNTATVEAAISSIVTRKGMMRLCIHSQVPSERSCHRTADGSDALITLSGS